MALYRHVGSKDDLSALMGDLAIGAPPKIGTPPGAWRGGLRQWARAGAALSTSARGWPAFHLRPAGRTEPDRLDGCALRVLRGTGLAGEKLGS